MSPNDHKIVNWALNKTDMKGYKCRRLKSLSGGEKQRTVIARTLAKDCPILVCDEPTGNLDNKNTNIVLNDFLNNDLLEFAGHVKHQCIVQLAYP